MMRPIPVLLLPTIDWHGDDVVSVNVAALPLSQEFLC